MKTLYLDESGDHNLEIIDPQYPVFVLGGVVMEDQYAADVAQPRVDQFKMELFGTKSIILHTADIVRNRNGFERMKDSGFRQEFFAKLNTLIENLDFQVLACGIRKTDHLSRYGPAALDPYFLSLNVLVERFCLELGKVSDGGWIIAEKRGPELDREMDLAWLNLKIQGTKFMQASWIDERICGLRLRGKAAELAGLELADLVVTPIGRHLIGKQTKEDFRIIERKFRRSPGGEHLGWGLVVLPKELGQPPLRSDQPRR
ncbi:MAG: DUF3800 domain-containing protein [Verrucomicrobia bacterium]|nr:DUF3800 domain-containing protein [Verrucomicrobiota bacterium]